GNYIARLVNSTHRGESTAADAIKHGASPRAALSLAAAAKARALIEGRPNASFEDVKALAVPVLQHRTVLDYGAKIDGKSNKSVIESLLKEVSFNSHPNPKPLKETVVQA